MKTIGNSQFTIARFLILALLLILILIKATPSSLEGKMVLAEFTEYCQHEQFRQLKINRLQLVIKNDPSNRTAVFCKCWI